MKSSPFRLSIAHRMTLGHFQKSLPRSRRSDFNQAARTVLAQEAKLEPDKVTRSHIVFATGLMVAAEQWQREGLTREEAMAETRKSVLTYGKNASAISMWLTERFSKDTFDTIRRYSLEKTKTAYGPTFAMSGEDNEPDAFASIVHRCGYRSFLARHGAEDLLGLFCAWDRVWIDALPKSIAFSRPTTIAGGGETCRFEFRRK